MSTGPTFIIALDLEFNRPSRTIIQIGAVAGDMETGNIDSGFSCWVNPHGPLNPGVAELTGLTQEVADAAPSVEDAYKQMGKWLRPYELVRSLTPLVWGNAANGLLCDAVGLQPSDEEWYFSAKANNVRQFFAVTTRHPLLFGLLTRFGIESMLAGSLEASVVKFGMTFEGQATNAMYRAANIFRLYRALIDPPAESATSNGQTTP